MTWKIATKNVNLTDPKIKKLFDEAVAAAPVGYAKTDAEGNNVTENTVAMLPRKPIRGRCRLCGQIDNLTKEQFLVRISK